MRLVQGLLSPFERAVPLWSKLYLSTNDFEVFKDGAMVEGHKLVMWDECRCVVGEFHKFTSGYFWHGSITQCDQCMMASQYFWNNIVDKDELGFNRILLDWILHLKDKHILPNIISQEEEERAKLEIAMWECNIVSR